MNRNYNMVDQKYFWRHAKYPKYRCFNISLHQHYLSFVAFRLTCRVIRMGRSACELSLSIQIGSVRRSDHPSHHVFFNYLLVSFLKDILFLLLSYIYKIICRYISPSSRKSYSPLHNLAFSCLNSNVYSKFFYFLHPNTSAPTTSAILCLTDPITQTQYTTAW